MRSQADEMYRNRNMTLHSGTWSYHVVFHCHVVTLTQGVRGGGAGGDLEEEERCC